MDPRNRASDRRVAEVSGGGWSFADFSRDGRRALVLEYVSITKSNPWLLELETGALTPIGDHRKAISYGEMVNGVVQVGVVAPDGSGAKVITSGHLHLYTRWSPDGKTLSYCRLEAGKPVVLVVSDPDGLNGKDLLSGVAPVPAEWKPK